MAKSILEPLGIFGWDKIEISIFCALMCNFPVLLVGNHGINKTEGARELAAIVHGSKAAFEAYDTSLISVEDLIGIFNPKSLSEGRLDYIRTKTSIWGKTSILLDELNRANFQTISRTSEIARTRKVLGEETDLCSIFGAVNPPKSYQTGYFDLAMASRWVHVQVPGQEALTVREKQGILKYRQNKMKIEAVRNRGKEIGKLLKVSEISRKAMATGKDFDEETVLSPDLVEEYTKERDTLKKTLEKMTRARTDHLTDIREKYLAAIDVNISDADLDAIYEVCAKVTDTLGKVGGIKFETRQMVYISDLLVAQEKLYRSGLCPKPTSQDRTQLILTMIPEVNLTTKEQADLQKVTNAVSTVLAQLSLNDPLTKAQSLSDFEGIDPSADEAAWVAQVKPHIVACKDHLQLKQFAGVLKEHRTEKRIKASFFQVLADATFKSYIASDAPELNKHLATPDGVANLIKKLFA
jgi:AAA domain (dynein-related subfamily)